MISEPRRIAVFAVLWEPGLGDLIQRNTFTYLLRKAYPAADITLVVGERTAARFAEFLHGHSFATSILAAPDFGRPGTAPEFRDQLRSRGFDLAVIDPDSLGLLAQDAADGGVPARIGFATGAADDRFLTTVVRLPRPIFGAPDLVDFAQGLASAIGVPVPRSSDVVAPFPYRPAEGGSHDPGRGPSVLVFPGGSQHWNRRWPAAAFVALCTRLARECDATIVLLGDTSDLSDLAAIAGRIHAVAPEARVTVDAGGSLNRLAGTLASGAVLVGNDSAPAHLAAALGLPAVVLYGPTATEFFIARAYYRQRGINHRHSCQGIRNLVRGKDITEMPCEAQCAYRYRDLDGPYPACMTDIGVDEVYRSVVRVLRPAGTASA